MSPSRLGSCPRSINPFLHSRGGHEPHLPPNRSLRGGLVHHARRPAPQPAGRGEHGLGRRHVVQSERPGWSRSGDRAQRRHDVRGRHVHVHRRTAAQRNRGGRLRGRGHVVRPGLGLRDRSPPRRGNAVPGGLRAQFVRRVPSRCRRGRSGLEHRDPVPALGGGPSQVDHAVTR